MPESCTIERGAEGEVMLGGALTFASTPALYESLRRSFRTDGRAACVDLAGITRADSAGLALLLEWQAVQPRNAAPIGFRNVPDMLMSLARLCEADEVLDLSGRGGEW